MQKIKKTTDKVVDAVAVARDESLVKLGKDAEARLAARASRTRPRKGGRIAMAAVVAGGAVAAGVFAAKTLSRKKHREDETVETE